MVETEHILDVLREIVSSDQGRATKAKRIADVVRGAGQYRWVGLYDVSRTEISILGWSGAQAPAYPRFPANQGLGGAAVSTGRSVVVGDVTRDPRCLATFGSTRSEMVVPIADSGGTVSGLIDVESEAVDAFHNRDRELLERCAGALISLFGGSANRASGADDLR